MICKKCGCRVSDTAAFCEKCGAPMAEFGEAEPAGMAQETTAKKQGISKKLIVGVAVLVAALIAFIFAQKSGMFLDDETKYAIQAAQAIQDGLLVPDSINVLDAYVSVQSQEEIAEQTKESKDGAVCQAKVYIYCTAQNKGGGITDKEYVCHINTDKTYDIYSLDRYIEMYAATGADEATYRSLANKIWNATYIKAMENAKEVEADAVNKNL